MSSSAVIAMGWLAEDKQHMQQEMEARRQDLLAKERSLDQAEAAAERRWAKLTEDVSAKVSIFAPPPPCIPASPLRAFCF